MQMTTTPGDTVTSIHGPGRRGPRGWYGAIAAGLAALSGSASAVAQAVELPCTMTIEVDAVPAFEKTLLARPVGDGETVQYAVDHRPPIDPWRVESSLFVVHDTEENGVLSGEVVIENLGHAPREFRIAVHAIGCPKVIDACEIGGAITMRTYFDAGGGLVYVPYGREGFSATIDESARTSLLEGPFFMMGSGEGSVSTELGYGQPAPGLPVGSMESGFGFEIDIRISGGERVEFTIAQLAGGPYWAFEPCEEPGGEDDGPARDGRAAAGSIPAALGAVGPPSMWLRRVLKAWGRSPGDSDDLRKVLFPG